MLNTPFLLVLIIGSFLVSVEAEASFSKENQALPPVAVCKNLSVFLGPDGTATITGTDIDGGSYDPDGTIVSMTATPDKFNCSETGVRDVVLTVTDNEGLISTCHASVTVSDNTPPQVNVKPFTLTLNSSGTATLLTVDIDDGSTDNCGSVALSISKANFTCNDLGENQVTLRAQDSHGNSSSRSTLVTVISPVNITGMSLSSCDLSPSLALFEADVEGGTGPYSYLWKGIDETTLPFMVILPFPPSLILSNSSTLEKPFFNNTMENGLYDIRLIVTDANGCIDSSDIKVEKTGIVFDNVTMRYSEACIGDIKTYSVTGDPDATYSWEVKNGSILTSNQNTNSIEVRWDTGEVLGVVTATLHEPNIYFPGEQCVSFVVDTVTLIPIPTPAFNNPALQVCSGSTVTYTLSSASPYNFWKVTGGNIINGGDTDDSFITVSWGTGSSGNVSVSSGNNPFCTGFVSIDVSIFKLAGSITSLTSIKCNGGSDGAVTASVNAGTYYLSYEFSLDGGVYQSSGTFSGLSLGNHVITIRDALGCTIDLPFVIAQPNPVTGSVSSQTNVSCYGLSDGSVSVVASGGTPPYRYKLNSGIFQDMGQFSGLAAGTHIVTISDSHDCASTVNVTITQPSAILNGIAAVTDVTCYGGRTGKIDLTVTGGTPTYGFTWSNGALTEDLTDVAAGTYSVTITDSHNCIATVSATVNQPAAGMTGNTSVTNVLCFGDATGSISLVVNGGNPDYSYQWSNGAVTRDISNLTAGTYTVIVTDRNGCVATFSANVTGPPSALSGAITAQNNVLCKGGSTGSVTVDGSGGTGSFQYKIDGGTFQPSGTFGSLAAGNYSITIRDENNCTFILPVSITEPSIALGGGIISMTDAKCFNEASGSVTVTGSGGTPQYQFKIDGGSYQPSGLFANLAAGPHLVTILDNNLCTFQIPLTISQPSSSVNGSVSSQTNVSCFGAATGSVTVTGTGGMPDYTYSIDGNTFQPSGTFNNLGAGLHNVIVRDINLCLSGNIPVTITQPSSALTVQTSHTNVLCFGEASGSATASASGGTPLYSYSWNTIPVQNISSVTNLIAGTYTVTVTDSKGCSASSSVIVTQPAGLLMATLAVSDVACFGGSTGSVNLTVANGETPVTYNWDNGAATEDLTGLSAGNYHVVVTDGNGCTASASGTVNQPAALQGNITSADVSCFGGLTGSMNLAMTGGTLPYSYLWNNGSTTEDLTGIGAGNYSVTVTDANNCTFSTSGSVLQPAAPLTGTITSQTNVTEYGGNDGNVTVSGSGGTSGYEYRINNGNFQLSGTFTQLTAGSYTVTVRDANMCTFDIPVTITQPIIPLTLKILSSADVTCNGAATGSVTVAGWGGHLPYVYSINGGQYQASGTFGSLAAGTYTLTVRDDISETFSTQVTIVEPTVLELTMSAENILCKGALSGVASVVVNGGVPPYTYLWNTNPASSSSSISNLGPGGYSVTVKDNNGCIKTGSVTITEPEELILGSETTDASCPDSGDGAIALTISGGTGPYKIVWSDGEVTQNRSNISPGTYSVVVTDQNLCAKSLQAEISFTGTFECVVIPQVITPNNDGFNDVWIIRNIDIYPDAEILVYNRWGKLVFRTKNLSANPWDGTDHGKPVPTDSYHYILYLNDGSGPRSGIISVIR